MTITPLTTNAGIRDEFLTSDSTVVFTDDRLNTWRQDAANAVQGDGIADETSERFYCCYQISKKLKHQHIRSENGVSFSDVDPEVWLDQYKAQIDMFLNQGRMQKSNSAADDTTDLNP